MGEVESEEGSAALRVILGAFVTAIVGLVALLIFNSKRQELKKKSASSTNGAPSVLVQPGPAAKKNVNHAKQRALASEKAHNHAARHHLDLVTLKGHADAVTGVAFTSNGRGLATACADQVVRVMRVEDAFNKSFKFLRLNLPRGTCPTFVAFGEGASKLVVGTQTLEGAGLCMFGPAGGQAAVTAKEQGKLPLPEIKWEKHKVHGQKSMITLVGASATYGSGDGSVIVASCSEGTDIKLWSADDGKCIGTVDTNQLKNTMAALSPDGRFLTAAAFTADVKVWELVYGKDGQVREVTKVMQLKGHKSAVTWLTFCWDSERIITASKDGSIRIWNINVRYHLDEDPKCLKVFPIPLQDAKGVVAHYEKIAVSPDNKVLAVTRGHMLQWLSTETGEVLETADNAHDGEILCLAWSPMPVPTERGKATILATSSTDKKVKLWFPPTY